MRKFYTILLVILLHSFCISAQHRSESKAIQIASDFFKKEGSLPQLSVVPQQKIAVRMRSRALSEKTASTNGFYIINDKASERFVIVSADERMHKILGYSNNGAFDAENAPCGLLDILDGYKRLYKEIENKRQEVSLRNDESISFPEIKPLISSKWGQDAPFYNLCPYNLEKSYRHPCVTGCVATAMAQVMNFYKYPAQGHGSHTYTTPFGMPLAMNFDTLHIDWSKIYDTYNYYTDDEKMIEAPERAPEEEAEVAKLMSACGISVSMKYGVGTSSAYSSDIPNALINNFGYNPNILIKSNSDFSNAAWDSIIVKELTAGHPILYSGSASLLEGHQFILDGCQSDGKYHFNFGWYGNDDGYYYLDGADGIYYKNLQNMVFQITPEEYGTHEDFTASIFEMNKIHLKLDGNSLCNIELQYSVMPFKGEYGVALFDTSYNYITSLYSEYQVTEDSLNLVVNGNEAGFLSSHIPAAHLKFYRKMTVSGELNGTDIKVIREMLNDGGSLEYLNLKNASIVAGGDAYKYSNTTKNNTVGDDMFRNSALLKAVILPANVEDISCDAFQNCPMLQSINVPEDNAYYTSVDGVVYAKDMRKLVLCPEGFMAETYQVPYGVEEISMSAFENNRYISHLYLPQTVTIIRQSAFSSCSMQSIDLPQGISSIGWYAFSHCKQLEAVAIPESLEKIPMGMLQLCENLKTVFIPNGVKEIDWNAFNGCSSLSTISSEIVNITNIKVPQSYGGGYGQFTDIPDTCTWLVHEGCDSIYKAQPWWRDTWRIKTDLGSNVKSAPLARTLISYSDGMLNISASKAEIIHIYTTDGKIVKSINGKAGNRYQINLPEGIYVINGEKIQIRK